MNAIFQFVLKHGYSILFAALFAHQVGFPIPGPLFLLVGRGARGGGEVGHPRRGRSHLLPVYWLTGFGTRRVVGAVTRCCTSCIDYTRDPDFHDRRAKRTFARYGLPLLLVAKFVPGLDAVSPPLAGISRTSRVRFLAFDAVGAALYACVYGGLGYVFSHDLDRAAAYVSRAGSFSQVLHWLEFSFYIAHKLVQRHRSVRGSRVVRIAPVDRLIVESPLTCPAG